MERFEIITYSGLPIEIIAKEDIIAIFKEGYLAENDVIEFKDNKDNISKNITFFVKDIIMIAKHGKKIELPQTDLVEISLRVPNSGVGFISVEVNTNEQNVIKDTLAAKVPIQVNDPPTGMSFVFNPSYVSSITSISRLFVDQYKDLRLKRMNEMRAKMKESV
ncbi:MAG: hypothetical protein WC967_12170 [Balneolaceae bacterium]